MKQKKDLTQLVRSDYMPLRTDAEGRLCGGFGSVFVNWEDELEELSDTTKQKERATVNPKCVMNICPSKRKSQSPKDESMPFPKAWRIINIGQCRRNTCPSGIRAARTIKIQQPPISFEEKTEISAGRCLKGLPNGH